MWGFHVYFHSFYLLRHATAGGLLKISRAQYTSTGIAECNAHCHLVCTMLNTSKTVEHVVVGISDAEPWADEKLCNSADRVHRAQFGCRQFRIIPLKHFGACAVSCTDPKLVVEDQHGVDIQGCRTTKIVFDQQAWSQQKTGLELK